MHEKTLDVGPRRFERVLRFSHVLMVAQFPGAIKKLKTRTICLGRAANAAEVEVPRWYEVISTLPQVGLFPPPGMK